jgi:LacI family transcriptional regulator
MSSLTDVARIAEVSVATASRVLSGSPHPVSEETRNRVVTAARTVGYTPNGIARALVTRRSTIIGVIVGDIVDPYFSEITRGADDVAREYGFLTMVCNADGKADIELAHVRALHSFPAAGIIFAGSGRMSDSEIERDLAEQVDRAAAAGTRVVALAKRSFDSDRILIDNVIASRDITRYLISIGHRRIAFIEGTPDLYTSRDRRQGFDQAMSEAGLASGTAYRGGFSLEAGEGAARRLITEGLPDAIVAANDEAAIGALMTLRQAGVDVPGTVSIAGFDDTQPARIVGLTTVRVRLDELGAAAALAIVEAEAGSEVQISAQEHEIVVRASTAPRPPS